MQQYIRLWSYTKQYWKRLVLSVVCAMLYGIVAAVPTWVVKHTVDDIFIHRYVHLIVPFLLLFLLFFVLKGIFMYLTAYMMHWVGNRVVNDIRYDLFKSMVYFPLAFFKQHTTGELMSHYLNDIQMIQNASASAVKNGVRSFFEAAFLIIFAFIQNVKLALLLLFVGPILVVTIKKMGAVIKRASRSIQHDIAGLSSLLQETFVGIREIKAFGAEKFEISRCAKALQRCFASIMTNVRADSMLPALVEVIAMAGGGVVFYIATHQVLEGSITPGQLTSFVAAVLLAYQPVKRLVSAYSEIQFGLAAAERVFALMDASFPRIQQKKLTLSGFKKDIVFEDVEFSYDAKKIVFSGVSLKIPKGSCVGILGPSGGGKSTLCDLLLGFIEPTAGSIYIDGCSVSSIAHKSLRQHIGYVGQRTFLFNDTIENNVAYAMQHVQHEDVVAACKRAHAHEFIQECDNGYQTLVGENGGNISGGQKQRLTIARALLKDPDILIFDEVTSALDRESEKMIQLALAELIGKKTIIIVSHRPALLEHVDMLLLMKNNRVVQVKKEYLHQFEAMS